MPELHAVMYHYVRDLPRTRYPRIRGLLVDDFRGQIAWLRSHFEMATLESTLDFLAGKYRPRRDLCVLTFDDGLREHFTEVMPILAESRIQGLFGIITGCVEEHWVAPVHMNHFLAAQLDFDHYRQEFCDTWNALYSDSINDIKVNRENAQRSYPLDTPGEAVFKWLINFQLPAQRRDEVIRLLFLRHCGEEEEFARELYLSWEEIRQLQSEGMLIAGHTHRHRPLANLSPEELELDIHTSNQLLRQHAAPQELWPFSYPYGKNNSYSPAVIKTLRAAGFDCAFTTESGRNLPGTPPFELFRTDCNGAPERLAPHVAVA